MLELMTDFFVDRLGYHYDIIQANADDFDRLFQLRISTMRESLERIGRYDERRAFERFRITFQPDYTRLIATADDLVGCIALKPASDGWLLEHFYVAPTFQSRGIGSAVLTRVLADAAAAGSPVHLSVLQQSDAARFYLRLGFQVTAQEEFDVFLSYPCSPRIRADA